jgi:GxxExxY protein
VKQDVETPMHTASKTLNDLSELIVGCAHAVSNTLGPGFVEAVYRNALAHELRKAGLHVSQQHPVTVQYDGVDVGSYTADMLVENAAMISVQATEALEAGHVARATNLLKATGSPLCLLFNFGAPRLEIRRVVNGIARGSRTLLLFAAAGG